MSFQVGDKVVCVDDSNYPDAWRPPSRWPSKGEIYVVRGISSICPCGIGLLLVGVHAEPGDVFCRKCGRVGFAENGFSSSRFRKLDELKREAKERQSVGRPATFAEAVRLAYRQRMIFVSGSTESRRARTRRDGTGRVNPPWGLLAREQRQAKARHSGCTDSSRDRVRPAHDSLSAHPKPGTVSLDRPDARVCANEPTAPNRIG